MLAQIGSSDTGDLDPTVTRLLWLKNVKAETPAQAHRPRSRRSSCALGASVELALMQKEHSPTSHDQSPEKEIEIEVAQTLMEDRA